MAPKDKKGARSKAAEKKTGKKKKTRREEGGLERKRPLPGSGRARDGAQGRRGRASTSTAS